MFIPTQFYDLIFWRLKKLFLSNNLSNPNHITKSLIFNPLILTENEKNDTSPPDPVLYSRYNPSQQASPAGCQCYAAKEQQTILH
jgi:hypothetical protein